MFCFEEMKLEYHEAQEEYLLKHYEWDRFLECNQIILNQAGKVGTYGDEETQQRCGYEWTSLITMYVVMQAALPLDHHPKRLLVTYTSEQEHLAD